MKSISVLLFAFLFLSLSCHKDDVTGPSGGNNFSVKISVKNSGGDAVAGLRISCWNKLNPPVLLQQNNPPETPLSTLAATIIGYDMPFEGIVTLQVLDMNDHILQTPVEKHIAPAGSYQVVFSINLQTPTRVLKYRFTAMDSSGTDTLYRGTRYAVLQQPDPSISILGWSSSEGTFQTSDSLLFPNTLTLPSLSLTADDPTVVGTFAITDSVVITLTDTSSNKHQTFYAAVRKGAANEIQLVWNPALAVPEREPLSGVASPQKRFGSDPIPVIPKNWALYQNYPNPFN